MSDFEDFNDEEDLDTLLSHLEDDDDTSTTELPTNADKIDKNTAANTSAVSLGLELSDDDNDQSNDFANALAKSDFAKAFAGLGSAKKCSTSTSQGSSTSHKKDTPIIDPLELEIRNMEEKMNKLKQELAKKKNIDLDSPSGSGRKFTKLTCDTSSVSKVTSRTLGPEEKKQLLQRIEKKKNSSLIHKGDTDSEDDEDNRNPFETTYSSFGKQVKKSLNKSPPSSTSYSSRNKFTDTIAPHSIYVNNNSPDINVLIEKKKAALEKIRTGAGWNGTKVC